MTSRRKKMCTVVKASLLQLEKKAKTTHESERTPAIRLHDMVSAEVSRNFFFYSVHTPTGSGMDVHPEASYSIQDPLGAVSIHVRKKGRTEMEPGLHYYAGRA
jgi:hypothetical protein